MASAHRFFDLSGQAAFVTGAARGIGEAICRRLGLAGAVAFVADLDGEAAEATAAKLRDEGVHAHAVQVDVVDRASVEAAAKQALAKAGKIEILVNNAGIAGRGAPVWEQTDEDWSRVIDINLTGVFHCCRALLPQMVEREYGRVVNIASLAGKEGNPNMSAYSASKAGVIALSKSLAKETAKMDICVNAISPTVVRTSILDPLPQATIDYMVSRIPKGRTCTVEEVAAVAHFLASPDSSFVTGQCYDVSGGRATY